MQGLTPQLNEISGEPHVFPLHLLPGFGNGMSGVFGKKILAETQLSEEDYERVNALVSLMPTGTEITKETVRLNASRFVKKKEFCEAIVNNEKLCQAAELRRQAIAPISLFVQTMTALRSHLRTTFQNNITDMLKFVDELQAEFRTLPIEKTNAAIASWPPNEEHFEALKNFVFSFQPPVEFTMVSGKVKEHLQSVNKELLPPLPQLRVGFEGDVEILRWLLQEQNDKDKLASLFLRISGLAMRGGSQAPTFLLIPHCIDEMLRAHVAILNSRNMLASAFHITETAELVQAVTDSSTGKFNCAAELATALGLELSSEFNFYESKWKAYTVRRGAFGTMDKFVGGLNPADLWLIHWAGAKTVDEFPQHLLEEMPAKEIKTRIQLICQKTKSEPLEEDNYLIDEWNNGII